MCVELIGLIAASQSNEAECHVVVRSNPKIGHNKSE